MALRPRSLRHASFQHASSHGRPAQGQVGMRLETTAVLGHDSPRCCEVVKTNTWWGGGNEAQFTVVLGSATGYDRRLSTVASKPALTQVSTGP